MPVIDMQMDKSIRNGSKIEFCTASMLTQLHMITCGDSTKLHSSINNNGDQFRIQNYTADYYCEICKNIYFINGSYKTEFCNYGHRQNTNSTFFGNNKTIMAEKFYSNLKKIISLATQKN